jgi:hypothetical protein
MRPESSLSVPFVETFSVRRELERFYYDGSIGDGFCSQTPSFGKVLIMSSQTKKVEPCSASESGVGRTESRDSVTRIDSTLVDTEVLQRFCIVVKRNPAGDRTFPLTESLHARWVALIITQPRRDCGRRISRRKGKGRDIGYALAAGSLR